MMKFSGGGQTGGCDVRFYDTSDCDVNGTFVGTGDINPPGMVSGWQSVAGMITTHSAVRGAEIECVVDATTGTTINVDLVYLNASGPQF